MANEPDDDQDTYSAEEEQVIEDLAIYQALDRKNEPAWVNEEQSGAIWHLRQKGEANLRKSRAVLIATHKGR